MDLPDSTPIAGDGGALRDRLAETGVLLFRRWADARALSELRLAMLDQLAGNEWLEPGSDPAEARPGRPVRLEGSPEWWDGYQAIQRLEAFHAAAHRPEIVSMSGELFGETPVVHPLKVARAIFPQEPGATTPPHQDFPHIGGTVDFFTLWVPLADTPASSGGLRVLPGSHRGGLRALHLDQDVTGGWWMEAPELESQWAVADYELGDALLFHSLIVHAGSPNLSDRLRLSLDFRYQPVSEPIGKANLYPHYSRMAPLYREGSGVVSWDDLTEGWSTRDWIATPAGTVVSDADPVRHASKIGDNAGRRNGASRFVDSSAFAAQVEDQVVLVGAQ